MTIRDPFDNVQYRFVLIPDYADDKGLIIVKKHHCMGDGLAFSALLLSLSEYDANALPGLKPMGWCKRFIIESQMIFRVPMVIWRFLVTWSTRPLNSI